MTEADDLKKQVAELKQLKDEQDATITQAIEKVNQRRQAQEAESTRR